MQLDRLTLTRFRAFEQATFDFHPGMNLLVGINGVGKSTVLDALRVLLSRSLPKLIGFRSNPISLTIDDIAIGQDWLYAAIQFHVSEVQGIQIEHEVQEWREKYGTINVQEGAIYEQVDNRNDIDRTRYIEELPKDLEGDKEDDKKAQKQYLENARRQLRQLKRSVEKPLAVYFSTRRSLSTMKAPSKQISVGGQAAAFAEALDHRELRLREFAEWWLVQEALAEEEGNSLPKRRLQILQFAVTSFLKSCTGLHAIREPETTLVFYKAGTPFDVRQLSDGERGVLALVLDLARRLSWANPNLDNPLQDGKAVVLIDELDLHLHPRWQRSVVDKLTETFPSCQFIATTHSPQIIGEVPPENILILENGEIPYQPEQSLGMDSNWVLNYLMEASDRDVKTKQELARIARLIEGEEYDTATDAIDDLRAEVGEFPELVRLQTRIDRIRLLGD